MANGHGGSRVPSNPAPVSGPGALSQRTDGQAARYMSGGQYGEGQEMMELQTSAPMSEQSSPAPRARSGGRAAPAPQQSITPLFAPTERPDEPITAGAPFGPGPGAAQATPVPRGKVAQPHLEVMRRYLPVMRELAQDQDAPERFKALVRYLEGSM